MDFRSQGRTGHRPGRRHRRPARPRPRAPPAAVPRKAKTPRALEDMLEGARTWECRGGRGGRARATLTPGFPAGRAEVTGLLERPLHEGGLTFELRPFQILTVRLRP